MPESLLGRPTVYGRRAKLGVIVPSTNTTNEAEWHRLLPADVTMHTARMPLHSDSATGQESTTLLRAVEQYAAQLALAQVDVIAYACTLGSLVTPVAALAEHLTRKTAIASVSTAQAIAQALDTLQVRTLAIATPYHDALNSLERQFFLDIGFEVVSISGFGYGENGVEEFRNIARIDTDKTVALTRAVDRPGADAVLISCTDLATLPIIDSLEAELRKPVISSNSATLWASLRLAGIDDPIMPGGTLLRDH